MSVVGHSLHQFSATLLVSCCSFACRTDNISQHSIMLQKTPQKINADLKFFIINFFSCDDRSKPVPSTSSEPVDNRLPIRDGKQTNKQSVNTSRSLRSNQAPLRNVDCNGGSRILTAELVSIGLAHIFN